MEGLSESAQSSKGGSGPQRTSSISNKSAGSTHPSRQFSDNTSMRQHEGEGETAGEEDGSQEVTKVLWALRVVA